MTRYLKPFLFLSFLALAGLTQAGSITVAPADADKETKRKADLVCDGRDDQVELLASLTKAARHKVVVDKSPSAQQEVECYARHEVKWLPGTYHLGKTLVVPDMADAVIQAEGTFFSYRPTTGDAVVLTGMNRCRFNFGTIQTSSTGAAIRVQPAQKMPALMSFVNFTGLIGTGQQGIGLHLDHRYENVCVNRFVGTDIYGFDTGVLVDDVSSLVGENRPTVKSDTNWYWLSYVRLCNTCIWEKAGGVDSGQWYVNVDASLPNSTAIRTAGAYSKWTIIMGTYSLKGTKAIVLDPGAKHQILEMVPPAHIFAPVENNSGNDTNRLLTTDRPPYDQASTSKLLEKR